MISGLMAMLGTGLRLADPDNPPPRCSEPNADGVLPTCTFIDGKWQRTYESDFLNPGFGGAAGAPGADLFAGFFVLALMAGIGFTIWKVSTARRMARESGMSERDATTMALLSDDGFEATYLASNLRGRPPIPAPGPAGRTTAERLRELETLREQGLISDEEHETARRAILDGL